MIIQREYMHCQNGSLLIANLSFRGVPRQEVPALKQRLDYKEGLGEYLREHENFELDSPPKLWTSKRFYSSERNAKMEIHFPIISNRFGIPFHFGFGLNVVSSQIMSERELLDLEALDHYIETGEIPQKAPFLAPVFS